MSFYVLKPNVLDSAPNFRQERATFVAIKAHDKGCAFMVCLNISVSKNVIFVVLAGTERVKLCEKKLFLTFFILKVRFYLVFY